MELGCGGEDLGFVFRIRGACWRWSSAAFIAFECQRTVLNSKQHTVYGVVFYHCRVYTLGRLLRLRSRFLRLVVLSGDITTPPVDICRRGSWNTSRSPSILLKTFPFHPLARFFSQYPSCTFHRSGWDIRTEHTGGEKKNPEYERVSMSWRSDRTNEVRSEMTDSPVKMRKMRTIRHWLKKVIHFKPETSAPT